MYGVKKMGVDSQMISFQDFFKEGVDSQVLNSQDENPVFPDCEKTTTAAKIAFGPLKTAFVTLSILGGAATIVGSIVALSLGSICGITATSIAVVGIALVVLGLATISIGHDISIRLWSPYKNDLAFDLNNVSDEEEAVKPQSTPKTQNDETRKNELQMVIYTDAKTQKKDKEPQVIEDKEPQVIEEIDCKD